MSWRRFRRAFAIGIERSRVPKENAMVITENSTVPFCNFMAETPGGHYRYFFRIHSGIPGGVFLEYFDHIGKGYKQIDFSGTVV